MATEATERATTFTLTAAAASRAFGGEGGVPRSLTWTDGVVTGDELAAAMVRNYAREWDGKLVGPPNGPYTTTDHLASPYSARALMLLALGPAARLTSGALPALPDPPEGAVR